MKTAASQLVLVVEDDREMNAFLSERLASGGLRVERAFDGADGIARAVELCPDLVLTDAMTPRVSGDELVRELRRHPELAATLIVAITAKADDELRARMLREGAQDWLAKPFSAEELDARIGNLLARKRAEEHNAALRRQVDEAAMAGMAVSDITTRKQLEHLREEWVSIIAHDLRQPINAIVLFTDLLLRRPLDGADRDRVTRVRGLASQLGRMVNELSDASQLESHRLTIARERLELGAVVREAVERVPGAAARTSVRAPIDRALFVRGDAGRLEQVTAILLSNAVTYGTPDTEIRVEVAEANDFARISVANAGPGIPADELPQVFECFTRTERARAGAVKGSGLGLYIARGLIEAHGGQIWVDSTPARDTTFHFTLPLVRDES